jgi:hypothetical protein
VVAASPAEAEAAEAEEFVADASQAAHSTAPTARDEHISAGLRLAAAQRRRALSLSSYERLTEFYGEQYDRLFLERGEHKGQVAAMSLAVGMATGGGALATAAVAGGCATVEAGLDVMAGGRSGGDALGHIVGETAGALFMFKAFKGVGYAVSKASGVAQRVAARFSRAGCEIKLIDGFYQSERSAFKFSEYYYNKLWATGRGAPFVQAEEVLKTAKTVVPDRMAGFNRYVNDALEMVYNPKTKEVWHLQPLRK